VKDALLLINQDADRLLIDWYKKPKDWLNCYIWRCTNSPQKTVN